MRWGRPAGVAIKMRLTIFPVTVGFLIALAAKRLPSLMMQAHPEPIDRSDPGPITESYIHLPDCRHALRMWNSGHESVGSELAYPRLLVYVLATP